MKNLKDLQKSVTKSMKLQLMDIIEDGMDDREFLTLYANMTTFFTLGCDYSKIRLSYILAIENIREYESCNDIADSIEELVRDLH